MTGEDYCGSYGGVVYGTEVRAPAVSLLEMALSARRFAPRLISPCTNVVYAVVVDSFVNHVCDSVLRRANRMIGPMRETGLRLEYMYEHMRLLMTSSSLSLSLSLRCSLPSPSASFSSLSYSRDQKIRAMRSLLHLHLPLLSPRLLQEPRRSSELLSSPPSSPGTSKA